jgi:hypothetical protein
VLLSLRAAFLLQSFVGSLTLPCVSYSWDAHPLPLRSNCLIRNRKTEKAALNMRIQKDILGSIVLAIAIVGGGLWLLDRSSMSNTWIQKPASRNPLLRKIGYARSEPKPGTGKSPCNAEIRSLIQISSEVLLCLVMPLLIHRHNGKRVNGSRLGTNCGRKMTAKVAL